MKNSVMQASLMLLALLFAMPAHAANGDRFNGKNVIVTPDDEYWCRLEVVSEADATVKIISREDEGKGYVNTLASVANVVQSFWIRNEVKNNGKTYRIIGIGKNAFRDMAVCNEIAYLGDYIEFIEDGAFWDCKKLVSVHLPEGLKTIGSMAFAFCYNLRCTNQNGSYDSQFVMPASLQRIEQQAFQGCTAITQIDFNDNLQYISRWGFSYCEGLTEVTLPDYADVAGNVFAHCDNLTTFKTKGEHSDATLYSDDGVLYRQDSDGARELAAFPSGKTGDFTIGDFVSSVGAYAFECSQLESVTIPQTVKSLKKYCFVDNLKLASVYVEWLTSDELPYADNPFYRDGNAPYRTLYVPKDGAFVDEQDIAMTYMYSDWDGWFNNIKTYDVANVDGLRVAGWPVKRTMVKNIAFPEIKDGRVSYDLATKTLTLEDAVIQTSQNDEWGVGNYGIRGLTIKLIGENEFNCNSAGIYASKNTYIEGPGSLNITSNYEEAIRLEYWDLYIDNASLYLDSRGGVISGDGLPYVNVTNSYLYMTPTYATGVATVNGIARFNVDDCYIDQPIFGGISGGDICDWKGNPSYGYVVVRPGNSFGFYIENDAVTDRNYTNIVPDGLSEGTISYDPDNNELTLNNVKHFSNNSFLLSNRYGLTVKVVGDNYINTTEDCFWLLNDMFIEGNGKLKTDADMGVAVSLNRDYTWLYCSNADFTLNGVGGAIYGDAASEAQGVTFSYADVKLSSNGNYQVTKNLDYMELENCQFADNRYFFDEDSKCICDYDFYGDPVYQGTIVIVSDEKPTAVEQVPCDVAQPHQQLYDLQGRRVSGTPQKGIFIQNGRKVVVK